MTPILAWEEDGGPVLRARTPLGEVMGTLRIRRVDGAHRILDLIVWPQWRRQGAATALYARAQADLGALAHGALTDEGRAWLEAVEPGTVFAPHPTYGELWRVERARAPVAA